MANQAQNEISITFSNDATANDYEEIYKKLEEIFTIVSAPTFEESLIDFDNYKVVKISAESNWVMPIEELEDLVKNDKIKKIIGVSWDFSNEYCDSIELF